MGKKKLHFEFFCNVKVRILCWRLLSFLRACIIPSVCLSAECVLMWLCERNWLPWRSIIVISAPSSVLWRAEPAGQRSVELNKRLCFLLRRPRRVASHLPRCACFEMWEASDETSVKETSRQWDEWRERGRGALVRSVGKITRVLNAPWRVFICGLNR